MTTLASSAAGRAILVRMGVQPAQYDVLVKLFRALGDRKELTGNLGMDRHAMQLTSASLLLPGALLALIGFGRISLAQFDVLALAMSSLLLIMLLVLEAANSFFNPAEISVLAHRPISGATYFAAKFTYLVQVVLWAGLALNGPASLVGLLKPDARWFYPLTHMAAAWGLGLCIALSACAVFGLMFRLLPASRLRSAALWVQLSIFMIPLAANAAGMVARRVGPFITSLFGAADTAWDWSFVPVLWFHAIGVMGQGDPVVPLGMPAIVGMVIMGAFLTFGVRALSSGYMTRIVGTMRASRTTSRRGHASSRLARTVRALAGGSAAAEAAYQFITRMMRRDWQFRRGAMQLILPVLMFGPGLVISNRGTSPLGAATPQLVGLLPEVLPFGALGVCLVLSFSDHHRGVWMFNVAAGASLQAYLRGVYWTLWLLLLALPLTVVCAWFTWVWGPADAFLFSAYCLAVGSCLLGFQLLLLEALPFSAPPKAERPAMSMSILLVGGLVVGVGWVAQAYLIFQSRWLTAIATLGFAALAWRAAQYALRELHATARRQLALLGDGSPGMFQSVE